MNSIPTPPANDELDPSLAALLRGSDPCGEEHEHALARSRAHTASIPHGDYMPVFSQRTSPMAPGTARGTARARDTGRHPWSRNQRRAAAILATAAAAAIVAGVGVLDPWGNAPQPIAPPAVAPTPSATYFNPDDKAQMSAFTDAGGKRITGWLRPALPTDPPKLHRTGWLLNTSAVAGAGETVTHAEGLWAPIDLDERDTSRLGRGTQGADLVVVATTDTDLGFITPVPGPYGIMVTDAKKLARASVAQTGSLMTLEGTYLQRPDANYNGAMLSQFATFEMAYAYTGTLAGTPERFKATALHSFTDAEARSCIVASTRKGDKILSFPEGSTASASIADDTDPDHPVGEYPLRIMPRGGWLGEGDDSMFILDSGDTPTAEFTGIPTSTKGTCGEYSGEVVLFSAIAK